MAKSPHSAVIEGMLRRLPEDIARSLTPRQLEGLDDALRPARHPVDIRRTLSLGASRYYVVVLAGRERRSPDRLRAEKARRPLLTGPNVATMVGFGFLLLLSVIGAINLIVRSLG
jgi:hypothetical protein